MALGLVLIAMICATSASVVLFVYGFPLWAVILAYPLTGFVVLLPGLALFAWIIKHHPPEAGSAQIITSQSPAAPHPRSPAGSSNP